MSSLLLYFVRTKKGLFNKVRIRSFKTTVPQESLRIFTCNVDHERSWFRTGPTCMETWIPVSEQSASGLVCTLPSLDLNTSCHFEFDCSNDVDKAMGISSVSLTCSYEQDQAVVCSEISGPDSSLQDELFLYYLFAHPYTTPQTRTPCPQSVKLTPVHGDSSHTWPKSPPILIGHGGVGMKRAHYGPGRPWPDNTIGAFRRAEQLGLPMIECDATVTRDYRAVLLHHNFTVRFCPKYVQNGSCERTFSLEHMPDPPVDEETTNLIVNYSLSELRNMLGNGSASSELDSDNCDVIHPNPLALTDPLPDLSGNQGSPLPALADAFRQTSVKLGFNVELKYPRETLLGKIARAFDEAKPISPKLAGPHSYFANVNKFCDKILDTVWKYAGSRVMMLSSFNADVCAALRLKQSHIPVLFITRGGVTSETEPANMRHVDLRHENLGVAIRWAESIDLAGIVTLRDSLDSAQADQRSDELASRNLACFVYGVSEPSYLVVAKRLGLTGVIIDRVEQFLEEQSTASV